MIELNWTLNDANENDKTASRSQIIDWNLKRFVETSGINLLLKDKFYLKELKRIKKMYPRLQIYVGPPTHESLKDKRYLCIIEKSFNH